jgi:hypothetical protein
MECNILAAARRGTGLQFVWTRGGAYTFLPSLSAIRYLGSQMM